MQGTLELPEGTFLIRIASLSDIKQITEIYNQGIQDRIATLETNTKSVEEMIAWLKNRSSRHKVLVLEDAEKRIKGWASLNVFNARECYKGVADLSIYINREERNKKLGKHLLLALIQVAKEEEFYKMVLTTLAVNRTGHKLYYALGFTKVGTYVKQGMLDGKWIDVHVMEKFLLD
ncbi:arsinothricin resistance N-acetyltransferase ArsN1 family A [Pelosinus propionicus]|uniref:Phosphinothricin acetyltransferase n=1 Tax=Pelosinus propionicus DSM 13327 TaxID=1123291 RepID=A0A1I4L4D1_9FIRM|nr:arsinothricin resistance N-acetyltransferase ArsN1 family A [Pelosinus propionicus]SFL85870.1 phosphinothricin acetyltransferase [Pelosinus propionicus DSM 13327]